MLISFLALIALTNGIMGGIHNYVGIFLTAWNKIFGYIFGQSRG